MCGLVAQIVNATNGFTRSDIEVFEQSMILNQVRGDDSTGICGIDNQGVWKWATKLGHPKRLLSDHNSYGPIHTMLFSKGRLAFGHGRAATIGDVVIENAHPFTIKRKDGTSIIIVHNGTLSQYQQLPGLEAASVDSKWLGEKIAELGAEEALAKVYGAIATMWWDERDKTFNIYRNYDRPLFIARTECGRTLINSQRDVIEWMLFKQKWKAESGPYELTPFSWAKMTPEKDAYGWDNKTIVRHITVGGQGVHQSNFPHQESRQERRRRRYRGHGKQTESTILGVGSEEFNPYDEGSDDWLLVEGHIESINWEKGKKKVRYRGGAMWEEKEEREDLLVRKYYRPFKREICECYLIPGKETSNDLRIVIRNVDDEILELEEQTTPQVSTVEVTQPKPVGSSGRGLIVVEREKNVFIPDLACTFSASRPAQWKTMGPKGPIQHHAISDEKFPTFFQWYKNDSDGEFSVGEELKLEYYVSKPLQEKFLKAYCSVVRPEQELAVEFVFQTNKWDKKQLRKIAFFKGKIKWMRVMSQQERQESDIGSVVQIYMDDVEPLTAPKEPEVA